MSEYMSASQIANAKAGDHVITEFYLERGPDSEGVDKTATAATGEDGVLVPAEETQTSNRASHQAACNAAAAQVSSLAQRGVKVKITVEAVLGNEVVEVKQKPKKEKEVFGGMQVDLADPFGDNADVTPALLSATGTGGK